MRKNVLRFLRRVVAAVLGFLCLGHSAVVHAQVPVVVSREGVVHAASYRQSAQVCDGTTHPVHIRLEPNPGQHIQVGFFESSAGAIGPQWRTAGWMAALVATTFLGRDLHAQRISYTLAGLIDGPSAGALTTSGLLALMRGERILENVSMTGTINPDGTVGPVGGIPQKVMGAAHTGKKRFAVPLGQRRDTNVCTGNEEDVVALGRSLGVEVVEVGDIREVYTFLTGQALPGAAPAPLSGELPADVRAAFRTLTERWLPRYAAARQIVAAAKQQEVTPELRSIWQLGERLAKTAQDELQSAHEAAAFNRIWLAVLHAEGVAQGVLGMRALLTQGFPGLHAMVQQRLAHGRQQVEANTKALHGLTVSSSVDAGAVAMIGGNVAAAFTYLEQAERLLQSSLTLSRKARPTDYPEVGLLAFQALGNGILATALAEIAVETRGWLGRGGPALSAGPQGDAVLASAISLYRSTALSGLEYVDALVTAGIASANHIDMKTAPGISPPPGFDLSCSPRRPGTTRQIPRHLLVRVG